VAESLGIGYEAVSRMERGLIIPTVTRLVELAETLDCNVAELVTQSSDRATDQAQVIAQKLQRLTAADRAATMEIMDILIDRLAAIKKSP
jgi:transcriptional regulator with XRE-family HTH domain